MVVYYPIVFIFSLIATDAPKIACMLICVLVRSIDIAFIFMYLSLQCLVYTTI
jgi:hypothetical protein